MKKISKLGTRIYGIGSTPALDSSNERVKLEGIDISTLALDGFFNYEHKNDNALQICGRITEAKKIYKREECEDKRQERCWDHVGGPFLFVAGVLFDKFNHDGAKSVVAMMEFDKELGEKEEQWPTVGFSIEGSKLEVKGGSVEKCIGRSVSITMRPCNKQCRAYIDEEKASEVESKKVKISFLELKDSFKKAEDINNSLNKALIHPDKRKAISEELKEKRSQKQQKFVEGIKKMPHQSIPKPPPENNLNTKQPVLSGSAWSNKIDSIRQANKQKKPGAPSYTPTTESKTSEVKSITPKLKGMRKNLQEKLVLKKKMMEEKKQEYLEKVYKTEEGREIVKYVYENFPDFTKSEALSAACLFLMKRDNEKEEFLKGLISE